MPAVQEQHVAAGGRAPPPTSAPSAGAGCEVAYPLANRWSGGFQVDAAVTDTGSAAVGGWTLTRVFGGDRKVANGWSRSVAQSGRKVTVTSAACNATIARLRFGGRRPHGHLHHE
jgi:Cellulose binding domain